LVNNIDPKNKFNENTELSFQPPGPAIDRVEFPAANITS